MKHASKLGNNLREKQTASNAEVEPCASTKMQANIKETTERLREDIALHLYPEHLKAQGLKQFGGMHLRMDTCSMNMSKK